MPGTTPKDGPAAPLAQKPALTLAAARAIAATAEAEALRQGFTVCIAVVDDGGHLLYFARIDETQLGSVEVSIAKARSALLFKRPTKAFEERLTGGWTPLLGLSGAVPIEGGLPLVSGGRIVGAIGVSGGTSVQDGQVAAAGAAALE